MKNVFKLLVRINYYQDECLGFGDSGTFKYLEVKKSFFKFSSPTVSCDLTELGEIEFKKAGYDRMTMNWGFVDKSVFNKEVKELKSEYERISKVYLGNK